MLGSLQGINFKSFYISERRLTESVNSICDDKVEDDLPEDTNPTSEQMDSDESGLVPEQCIVDLNLDKGLQGVYNRVVEEAVTRNKGDIPGQEDGEMGGTVEGEKAGGGDCCVDAVIVPTTVRNPEDVVEEAVVDIREPSLADDDNLSVSFLLSNV